LITCFSRIMLLYNFILLFVAYASSGDWAVDDSDDTTYAFHKTHYNVVSLTWSDSTSYCHRHASSSHSSVNVYLTALPSGNLLKHFTLYGSLNHPFSSVISTITFSSETMTGLRLYTPNPQNQAFHSLKAAVISVLSVQTKSPSRKPTARPTRKPTRKPTVSPTRFCDAAICYGTGSFGANCSGPSDEIDYPITLAKSKTKWGGISQPLNHVEIFPAFSVDFQRYSKIRFETKITNISDGLNHGAVFAVSVQYGGCQSSHSHLFSLTQPMWAATSCADEKWHSWEVDLNFDAIEVFCDENLVWNHARSDMQVSWEAGEESPFLAIGAWYSPKHNTWQAYCDMVVQNVEILTCETETPSSTPSETPTSPTGTPSDSPTPPTNSPSTVPTVSPSANPTPIPTHSPSVIPTSAPTSTLPTVSPSANPTRIPTQLPTVIPTSSPTSSCGVFTALCYGQGAFGAVCNGPTTDLFFPVTLEEAKASSQIEQKGVCGSHIEVYPAESIDLTTGTIIRFNAKIFDIAGGSHYGAVFDLSVKYDGKDKGIFTFSQPILTSTPCEDAKWHLWEAVVFKNSVWVYCDEALVHTHSRTDSQRTWNASDDSPFLVLGAYYSNSQYYSRCHMILQDLRIFTCADI